MQIIKACRRIRLDYIFSHVNSQSFSQGDDDNLSPELFSDEGGYYKFPNGLILQWGTVDNVIFDERDIKYVYFPISFSHKCVNVQATLKIYTRLPDDITRIPGINQVYIEDYTLNYLAFYPGYANFSGNIGKIYWLAIGY